MYDSRGIEGVKAFATMLQNQDVGAVMDRRNGITETKTLGAKTVITTVAQSVAPV
jgi:hypothetical protein